RLAAHMPGTVNMLTHAPVLGSLAKVAAGIAPQRQIPAFAPQTFKDWFGRRGPRNEGQPQVILWPDTFNNHFHPATAQAAVEVLEAAGYQVIVPAQPLCCGRPLYDYGMLHLAQRLLRQILLTLRPQIRAGIPVVGLDVTVLDAGCCGMAGSFGFEKDHYDVSIKCGERVLLPAMRAAARDTLIIADGFSCREQIAQMTDRQALHLAQVIQMALRGG